MGRRAAIDPARRIELLDWLDDLRYARGRVYQFRMAVNYRELPSPSRTALRISRIERELGNLLSELEAAWEPSASRA